MNDARQDQHVLRLLQAYRDGELGAETAAAVRDHLTDCAACARAQADLEATWSRVAAVAPPAPPRPAWPDLRARLAEPRRARLPVGVSLAAALAGLAAGLIVGEPDRAGARGATGLNANASEWASIETLVIEGAATTLDGIYLDTTATGDEAATGGNEAGTGRES